MRKLIDHEKRFEIRYNKIVKENCYKLSASDIEVLNDFLNLCSGEGVSAARRYKYLIIFPKILKLLRKQFLEITQDDLIKLAGHIRSEDYSEQTKTDYLSMIKKFYKTITFLDKYENLNPLYYWIYDKRNKLYSTNLDRKRIKTTKQRFSVEDVKKIIDGASNFRDKAFFSILATLGLRPQEALGIRKRDIEIKADEDLIQLEVTGKTGSRYVFLTEEFARNFLLSHIETIKDDEEFIFPVTDRRMNDILKEICYKQGIKKKAILYQLRHFCVTQDRIKGLSAGALEQKFGWVKGSGRVRTYDHSTSLDYKRELTNGGVKEKPIQLDDVCDYNKLKNKKLEQEVKDLKTTVKELVEIFDWVRKTKGNDLLQQLNQAASP